MKRFSVSTTSALALLVFGGGQAEAAPIAAVADSLLFGTTDQADVVRESLSLGGPVTPLIAGVTRAAGAVPDRPTIADPSAQTPSATFTYRPAVSVRGDSGFVGSLAPNSRRNPGNISNLRGTVGSAEAGIFSVPATEILINETPARAYNYIFRPSPTVGSVLSGSGTTVIFPREMAEDHPGHSVFIGVRPPAPDQDSDAAGRRVSTLSATRSATPTVVVTPLPGPNPQAAATAASLGYRLDTGLMTTIGFSTKGVPPTPFHPGAASSSSLGYTYVPVGRRPAPDLLAEAARGSTLSATITAPGGDPARRDWRDGDQADPRDANNDLDASPVLASTMSGNLSRAGGIRPGVATDIFVVAAPDAGRDRRVEELVTIPILVKGGLAERGSAGKSMLSASQAAEMDQGNALIRYGLAATAVLLPAGLAFLGFRMVRRAALRRLG